MIKFNYNLILLVFILTNSLINDVNKNDKIKMKKDLKEKIVIKNVKIKI